jgi:hypothetical protein
MYAFSSASVVTKMAYSSSSSASARRSTALSAAGTSRVSSSTPAAALAAPPSKKLPSGEGSTEAAALIRTVWSGRAATRKLIPHSAGTSSVLSGRLKQRQKEGDPKNFRFRARRASPHTDCVVQKKKKTAAAAAGRRCELFLNFSQRLPAV